MASAYRWLISNYQQSWYCGCLTITFTTDVPVRAWMHWTDQEVHKHERQLNRRGLLLQADPDYCFDVWYTLPQIEPGDTLVHTFKLCFISLPLIRYFMFYGTLVGAATASQYGIFKMDGTAHGGGTVKCTVGYMNSIQSVEPVLHQINPAGAWLQWDASHAVPECATGVLLMLNNNDAGVPREIGFRPIGGTGWGDEEMYQNSVITAFCGINEARQFEAKGDFVGIIDCWVMGYTGPQAVYLQEPWVLSVVADTIYHNVDIHSVWPDASAVMFRIWRRTGGIFWAIRPGGAVYDVFQSSALCYPVCGVGANGMIEVKLTEIPPPDYQVEIIGYFKSGTYWPGTATDISPTVTNTWQHRLVNVIGAPLRFVAIDYLSTVLPENIGAQKSFSLRDITAWGVNHNFLIVDAYFGALVELYKTSNVNKFNLVGRFY